MEENEKVQKKEIPSRTSAKALINGFIAYGIIFLFIIIAVATFITWVTSNLDIPQSLLLTVCTSTMTGIIIYFLIKFLCKISTIDLLKECRIHKDDLTDVYKRMKVFYTAFAILSILVSVYFITIKHSNSVAYINEMSKNYYLDFKDSNLDIADAYIDKLVDSFNEDWKNFITSSLITEGFIFLSAIRLISYQKKLILRYN